MNSIPILYSPLAEATAGAGMSPGAIQIMMMGAVFVMFYFLFIRPQQMQRKQLAARVASLQSGDRVVTNAGIHGIVHNVKEHTVVIKVAEATMIEFDKAAVALVHKKESK